MSSSRPPATAVELDGLEAMMDAWLGAELRRGEWMVDVTRAEDVPRRWYVRLRGEEKDVTTIWLTLGQRTLKYETYVLPYPPRRAAEVFELALRVNYGLVGCQFGIGPEDALFLTGEVSVHGLDESELDRIVGTVFGAVERYFPLLVGLAFG
jgi:hypothetical protein